MRKYYTRACCVHIVLIVNRCMMKCDLPPVSRWQISHVIDNRRYSRARHGNPYLHDRRANKTCTTQTPGCVHQAGPAPFAPDIVGDHTRTHSPRTQSTRQHEPCPLEAAARVEGARCCCALAAAGPIACGVCVCISKKQRGLPSSRTTASTSTET